MKRWRKLLCAALVCALLLGLVASATAYTVPSDTVVYVTNTGTKYHRDRCTYLKSQRPMTIEEAECAGYGPCSRCHPDTLTGLYHSNYKGRSSESSTRKSGISKASSESKGEETSGHSLAAKIFVWVGIIVFFGPIALLFAAAAFGMIHYLWEKVKYTRLYGGHSLEELVEIPRGTEIGEDGLPKAQRSKEWGAAYTCYVTPKGRSYHRKYGCSKATQKVHVCQVMDKKSPCARCHPQTAEDLGWYAEYVKVKDIKQKYGIK